jgi:putative proteasome-type protease
MTYCLGLRLDAGIVMLSDTRTHAGVDHVARYTKLFTWEAPGTAAVCLCTAGNLSLTQSVVNLLGEGVASGGDRGPSVLAAPSMFEVAEIVGEALRKVSAKHGPALATAGVAGTASLLVGGEVGDGPHRLFHVYEAGNFIETDANTPFFQIGEFKYGKPILDRAVRTGTSIGEALKAAFLSMDSTIRSNLSVGMPLDLAVIPAGERRFATRRRVEEGDGHFVAISKAWSGGLAELLRAMPEVG